MSALSYAKLIEKKPWYVSWRAARRRCTDQNHKSFKNYGGKGIQFCLTRDECERLWTRDKAFLIDRPRLDRIDPSKNYCFANCRFISEAENLARRYSDTNEPTEWTD